MDVLSPESLADRALHPAHKQLVIRLREILDELPNGCVAVSWHDNPPDDGSIDIVPANPLSTTIMVFLTDFSPSRDLPPTVAVSAGEDLGLDMLDMQLNLKGADLVGYFERAVRGIIQGRLTETLYRRGDIMYRSVSWIDILPKPIELDRLNFPRWLRSLGRKKAVTTIHYEAFA